MVKLIQHKFYNRANSINSSGGYANKKVAELVIKALQLNSFLQLRNRRSTTLENFLFSCAFSIKSFINPNPT